MRYVCRLVGLLLLASPAAAEDSLVDCDAPASTLARLVCDSEDLRFPDEEWLYAGGKAEKLR